jgi:hypothetical protein
MQVTENIKLFYHVTLPGDWQDLGASLSTANRAKCEIFLSLLQNRLVPLAPAPIKYAKYVLSFNINMGGMDQRGWCLDGNSL